MIELLLATTLTCEQGQKALFNIGDTTTSSEAKNELVTTILEMMPDDCSEVQYDG